MSNMIKHLLLTLFLLVSGIVSAQSDSCIFAQNTFCGDCDHGTVFRPYFGCPITECKCTIYDRWGNLLYESTTLEPEFETYGLKEGTYFYTLKGKYEDGKEFNLERRFNYFR